MTGHRKHFQSSWKEAIQITLSIFWCQKLSWVLDMDCIVQKMFSFFFFSLSLKLLCQRVLKHVIVSCGNLKRKGENSNHFILQLITSGKTLPSNYSIYLYVSIFLLLFLLCCMLYLEAKIEYKNSTNLDHVTPSTLSILHKQYQDEIEYLYYYW